MRKDQANTMPPSNSSNGFTSNGKRSDAPDMESEGGNVPNNSIQWDKGWMDRHEGNIKGKNKDSLYANQKEYKDSTAF